MSAVLGWLILAVCAAQALGFAIAGVIVLGDHTRHHWRRRARS
jgi:hypothetical protein